VRCPRGSQLAALEATGPSGIVVTVTALARAPSILGALLLDAACATAPPPLAPVPPTQSSTAAVPPATSSLAPAIRSAETVVRYQIHPRAKACYQDGLQTDPTQEGKVVITLRIDATGAVERSSVWRNEGRAPAVASCIAEAAKQAHFDPPGPSGSTISIPFRFRRAGSTVR
jgi:TonB family protein